MAKLLRVFAVGAFAGVCAVLSVLAIAFLPFFVLGVEVTQDGRLMIAIFAGWLGITAMGGTAAAEASR